MNIREATIADIEEIARVHVACWRESYSGLLMADYLSNLSEQQRAEKWKKTFIEEPAPWKLFVAEEGGAIKGFTSSGKSVKSDLGIEGELYTLYLLKEVQGQGVGKKLFEKARNNLALSGINRMYLWVFKDNPTLEFYRHMGGHEFARQMVTIGGVELEEIALAWENVT